MQIWLTSGISHLHLAQALVLRRVGFAMGNYTGWPADLARIRASVLRLQLIVRDIAALHHLTSHALSEGYSTEAKSPMWYPAHILQCHAGI